MDSVSEALLAQLAKGTSSSGKGRDSVDVSKLPESIQKLVASLNKDAAARAKSAKAAKDEKDAAQKRQNTIDGLQREFNTNLKELVDITEELNKTQGDALKQAEKRAKKQEERFKKEEAARKRAEKIAALQSKPKDIMSGLKADFFGAIFGKGVGDFMKNVSRAKEQTKSDVSELAEARYADKIATAEEKKADAFSAAEAKREDTVEGAKAARKATLEKTTTEIGGAIQSAQENSNKQLGAEAAYAEWDKARKDRDSIAREGESRLSQAGKSAPTVGSSGGAGAGGVGGGAAAPAAPLIVSPTGDDALADAEVAKARREVAEANMAAEQAVSAAAEKLQAATGGGEVDKASIGYAGAVAGGEAAAAESRTSADATKEAIQDAILTESTEKANATYAAAQEKGMANAEMAKGNMVSAEEKSSIGKANMLSTAIAPPALVIIGKVMEKFQSMFPIIEQTGNSLIELATVIPATLFTITGQLTAKLLYGLASIRDAISTPDVRERYDKSDAEVHKASGKSRAELYAEAEERNLEAYKKNGTTVKTTQSTFSRAASATVTQNAPGPLTVENIPGTASGITHTAGTSYEARDQINAAAAARAAAAAAPVEKPMPVVSAGPSNSNVDQWRQ